MKPSVAATPATATTIDAEVTLAARFVPLSKRHSYPELRRLKQAR